ncbi:MAG: NTP transferase domain-containing protein [Melioribacteraceae bacterium]|nr:NTP transferase domain-containing protein [Saprospiraceae bacterium]MCF8355749.1 NTP transferase domain-containing protein [Melioribacteraceae bacterium]MCF8394777.1 NTP transferase domain-containing protein [Melioribacteraceae bacterium]
MLKEFSKILIDKSASAKDAMKQLDKTAEKILFVVEDNNKLIGSLTDGDIRRWILKDGDLNSAVMDVCFKGTYSIETKYDLEQVKTEILKRKIVYVPVVNENKEIVEFLIWDKLFDDKIIRKSKEKLNAEVVIMAGGKGSRLDPFTRILPKPLIPIGDKTILEIIIEKFTDYGNEEFYISVNHKAKIIKSYFEEIQPEYYLKYIYEEKPLGTVGALKTLDGQVKKDIILTNCDNIIEADYADLLEHHKAKNNDITIIASMKHYNIPYGICEIENGGRLVSINEKPEYDLLVNTGMYVLKPEVLKYIPKEELFHITHLIEKIKSTHKIGIYPISENSWIDTGEWVEYKKAVEKLRL